MTIFNTTAFSNLVGSVAAVVLAASVLSAAAGPGLNPTAGATQTAQLAQNSTIVRSA